MKRTFWLLLLIACCGQLHAQTLASFNFTAPGSTASSGWTIVSGDPAKAVVQATAGDITISPIATANWSSSPDGASAVNGVGNCQGGIFPGGVLSNIWYDWCGTDFTLGQYNPSVPQLQLSGLNKDSNYILRMTGSSSAGGNTQYTVSGAAEGEGSIDATNERA